MGRPRVVDVNYFDFQKNLRKAADQGHRIEKTDRSRWNAFIRENKILEASSISMAKAKGERVTAVIIEDGPWKGFYVYSPEDEFCLKFTRDDA